MRLIKREIDQDGRGDTFTLIPLGDVHLGAAACDEARLRQVVDRIKNDDTCYWIGMGDYADFINLRDPRFSVGTLPEWIDVADLADLARAERDKFLEYVTPIADKCLAMVQGNHEQTICRHYERDIYLEIVNGVKLAAGWPADYPLAVGYDGMLQLMFKRGETVSAPRSMTLSVYLHHGFGGGRLAGGKALNLQRAQMFAPEADLILLGHTHDVQVMPIGGYVVRGKKIKHVRRFAIRTGTFLNTANLDGPATYAEVKGYPPQPVAGVEIKLKPHAGNINDRIKVITW